jgi:hypothetical protein
MYFDESSQQYMCYDQASNSYLPYTPSSTVTSSASTTTTTPATPTTSENNVTDSAQLNSSPPKPKPVISASPTIVKSAEPVIAPRVTTPFAADQTPIPPPNVTATVVPPTGTHLCFYPFSFNHISNMYFFNIGPVKMTLKETKPKKSLSTNVPGIFAKKVWCRC